MGNIIYENKRILEHIMKCAKTESEQSTYDQFKLGAVLFSGRKILATGCNLAKGHPMQKKYNKQRYQENEHECGYVHAEMNAIINVLHYARYNSIKFNDLSIFVYREHKDGSYALARPCKACEKALRDLGIRNIYYTGEHSLVYEKYF